MGILEIHFHDSDFSWTVNPRESEGGRLSLSSGESSGDSSSESSGRAPDVAPSQEKGRMVVALAVLVGLGLAFGRLRNRELRAPTETEQSESGRRLSLSRLK